MMDVKYASLMEEYADAAEYVVFGFEYAMG